MSRVSERRRRDRVRLWPVILAGAASIVPTVSFAQAPGAPGAAGFDNNGEDITRPESKVEARLEERTSGTTSKTNRRTLFLRAEGVIDIKSVWGVAWLAQLPLVHKSTTESGTTNRDFGVGDIQLQAELFRPIDARWAYGFGLNLVTPSAGDSLGSGKWQMRPIVGLRYSFLEFGPNTYFTPKIRYAVSVGGDPSRRKISEPQIAPTLNIGLGDRWFVTLYPSNDIRINLGDPVSGQTGRLFLPFDAAVGRKFAQGISVSLELGVPIVKDYPVYKLKARLRAAARF
jgi:hypothetical protein